MASRGKSARKRGKSARVRQDAAREKLVYLADDLEMPLAQAAYLVRALEFVGYGMHSHGDDAADAVIGLAVSLADSLDVVKSNWQRLTREI